MFTVSTLTSGLVSTPIQKGVASGLYREANLIANDYLPGYFAETVTKEDIDVQLQAMQLQLNAAVWFVDREGHLITAFWPDGYREAPAAIENFNPAEIGSAQYQIGDYHGCFLSDVMTVIAPVNYEYSPKGYLLLHKAMSDSDYFENLMIRAVYVTVVVVYIFSFLIMLALHFFVFWPLRRVTEAATQYATGNLDYEIPVRTADEMGYLSASLNYMSAQLRDMEDYQKKFVANVSHDFRSPLTSIKGYIEAMADGTIPPQLHGKYLRIILLETERLTDLTNDLLTLNEYDRKNLLLEKERFDIHEMIKQVAAAFEGACIQKKISFDLIFETKVLKVYADKGKIQQVLYNLIDNAIKFSETDSIITIETTERSGKVFTSVKDDGIGIPRNSLNKIWDRFYKTDLSRGRDRKGTGLGLSIVKEAIQAHGENINVISTEGVGTEFVFSLPKG